MTGRAGRRRSSVSDGAWLLLSFAGALVFHAAWLAIPLGRPASRPLPEPPTVTALVERIPGGWSPTLFSLPSVTGFSGAMKQDRFQTLPPLQSPLNLTGTVKVPFPEASFWDPVPLALPPSSSLPLSAQLELPDAQPPASMPMWSLELPDLALAPLRLSRRPEQEPSVPRLDLTGEIAFSEGGRVSSLVVHPPVPRDPAVQGMIRVLRRVRSGSDYPVHQPLRFRFSYRSGDSSR